MKRLIIIAILILVGTIGLKAQTPTNVQMETLNDSISVMFQHLARTNAELNYLNENVRLHSKISLLSFALEGVGVACLLGGSSSNQNNHYSGIWSLTGKEQIGVYLCVFGGLVFLSSYIPIWNNKIQFDERGLIIPID